MLSCETELLLLHIERSGFLYLILSGFDISDAPVLLQCRERTLHCLDVILLQLALDDRVIVPIDEGILRGLVADDTHLGIHIVLHAVVITV